MGGPLGLCIFWSLDFHFEMRKPKSQAVFPFSILCFDHWKRKMPKNDPLPDFLWCVPKWKAGIKISMWTLVSQFCITFLVIMLLYSEVELDLWQATYSVHRNTSLHQYAGFLAENRWNGKSCEIPSAICTQYGVTQGFSQRNVWRWCA